MKRSCVFLHFFQDGLPQLPSDRRFSYRMSSVSSASSNVSVADCDEGSCATADPPGANQQPQDQNAESKKTEEKGEENKLK